MTKVAAVGWNCLCSVNWLGHTVCKVLDLRIEQLRIDVMNIERLS